MHDAEEEVERAEIPHGELSIRNGSGIVGKKPHERRGEHKQQRARCESVAQPHGERDAHALFHALHLTRAEVLPGKRRHREAEAQHREDVEAVDLHISAEACHRVRAKGVDA